MPFFFLCDAETKEHLEVLTGGAGQRGCCLLLVNIGYEPHMLVLRNKSCQAPTKGGVAMDPLRAASGAGGTAGGANARSPGPARPPRPLRPQPIGEGLAVLPGGGGAIGPFRGPSLRMQAEAAAVCSAR